MSNRDIVPTGDPFPTTGRDFAVALASAREGNKRALASLWRELQPSLLRYLRAVDPGAAEDIASDTWLEVTRCLDRFSGDERAFRGWLLRVATNHALGLRRRGGRVVRLHVVPDRADALDLGRISTDRVALLAGLAELPPAMRAAVVLRYYADLPVDEVAAALGKSPNTIKAQLQTALDRLRRSLADPVGTSVPEANHA